MVTGKIQIEGRGKGREGEGEGKGEKGCQQARGWRWSEEWKEGGEGSKEGRGVEGKGKETRKGKAGPKKQKETIQTAVQSTYQLVPLAVVHVLRAGPRSVCSRRFCHRLRFFCLWLASRSCRRCVFQIDEVNLGVTLPGSERTARGCQRVEGHCVQRWRRYGRQRAWAGQDQSNGGGGKSKQDDDGESSGWSEGKRRRRQERKEGRISRRSVAQALSPRWRVLFCA